jgi:RNA-directed DNA polymerase
VKDFIATWLQTIGLELKPSKTRITHTLRPYPAPTSPPPQNEASPDGPTNIAEGTSGIGFDFLGFEIRQYRVGKSRTAHNGRRQPLGFKTIMKPSKANRKRHRQELAAIVDQHRQAPQAGLIGRLNPKLRGWATYYATVCSKHTLQAIDAWLFHKLWAWARRRHPKKGKRWRAHKYWGFHPVHHRRWIFAAGPLILYKSSHVPIRRHVKVRGGRSPFDGDWRYWAARSGSHPEIPNRLAFLLKRQRGTCARCRLYFREDDVLEVDHIRPRADGGPDSVANLQLLHRHCHDAKTAIDLRRLSQARPCTAIATTGSSDDNSQ